MPNFTTIVVSDGRLINGRGLVGDVTLQPGNSTAPGTNWYLCGNAEYCLVGCSGDRGWLNGLTGSTGAVILVESSVFADSHNTGTVWRVTDDGYMECISGGPKRWLHVAGNSLQLSELAPADSPLGTTPFQMVVGNPLYNPIVLAGAQALSSSESGPSPGEADHGRLEFMGLTLEASLLQESVGDVDKLVIKATVENADGEPFVIERIQLIMGNAPSYWPSWDIENDAMMNAYDAASHKLGHWSWHDIAEETMRAAAYFFVGGLRHSIHLRVTERNKL